MWKRNLRLHPSKTQCTHRYTYLKVGSEPSTQRQTFSFCRSVNPNQKNPLPIVWRCNQPWGYNIIIIFITYFYCNLPYPWLHNIFCMQCCFICLHEQNEPTGILRQYLVGSFHQLWLFLSPVLHYHWWWAWTKTCHYTFEEHRQRWAFQLRRSNSWFWTVPSQQGSQLHLYKNTYTHSSDVGSVYLHQCQFAPPFLTAPCKLIVSKMFRLKGSSRLPGCVYVCLWLRCLVCNYGCLSIHMKK